MDDADEPDVKFGKPAFSTTPDARIVNKDYDIPRVLELALSAIRQSVLIADRTLPDFPVIYANAAFEQLTGYTQDEVVGRNCRFLTGPDTSPVVRAKMADALAQGEGFHGLILNYRRDGSAFWNDLAISPVDDGTDGQYWIGVQTDVTDRLGLEARLRESQKMEALGKLSGGIAHDFNNLLAIILGNAELIAGETAPGSLSGDAAVDIIEAADGGSKLVARMLQYAREEVREPDRVQLQPAIESVMTLFQRTIGDRIRLESDFSAAVDAIKVDRTLFETALINLVVNARDAMPKGGTIRISTRRRANAGPELGEVAVVAVEDTGTGMDAETVSRAFEPFFTTKQSGRGNGLGLAMVYSFVHQSAGDVSIDSKIGRGTTVTMLLPVADAASPSIEAKSDRPCILVVEDDAKIRKVIAQHLTRGGFVVDEVGSAEEALRLLDGGSKPAMLVSDIRLRDVMNGVELAAAARRRDPDLPILLITGFAEELEGRPDFIRDVPVLLKPFRYAELLAEVSRKARPGNTVAAVA